MAIGKQVISLLVAGLEGIDGGAEVPNVRKDINGFEYLALLLPVRGIWATKQVTISQVGSVPTHGASQDQSATVAAMRTGSAEVCPLKQSALW